MSILTNLKEYKWFNLMLIETGREYATPRGKTGRKEPSRVGVLMRVTI
jgi:hypothetical protein